jgi:excisionase family DNA binding protein
MSAPTIVDVLLAELQAHPDALAQLAEKIAPLIAAQLPHAHPDDGWLDSKRAADYLGITHNALRKHTAERTIPFEQDAPGGKCWFKRAELDAWRRGERGSNLGSNRRHSTAQAGRARTPLQPVNTG